MTGEAVVYCEPVETFWWSQNCEQCHHALVTHRIREIWVLEDGSELLQPLGEVIEIPEGAVKVTRSECSSCNLKAAIGNLVTGINNLSEAMRKANERMDAGNLPQIEEGP